jgi:hypothetical protein
MCVVCLGVRPGSFLRGRPDAGPSPRDAGAPPGRASVALPPTAVGASSVRNSSTPRNASFADSPAFSSRRTIPAGARATGRGTAGRLRGWSDLAGDADGPFDDGLGDSVLGTWPVVDQWLQYGFAAGRSRPDRRPSTCRPCACGDDPTTGQPPLDGALFAAGHVTCLSRSDVARPGASGGLRLPRLHRDGRPGPGRVPDAVTPRKTFCLLGAARRGSLIDFPLVRESIFGTSADRSTGDGVEPRGRAGANEVGN